MGLPELLAILLVVAVCGLLMAGYPVAFTLGGVALAFAVLGDALGVMQLTLLGALPPRVFGVLMSLEPAAAAFAGLVVLGQDLDAAEVAAIALVVAASAGAAYSAREGMPPPVVD